VVDVVVVDEVDVVDEVEAVVLVGAVVEVVETPVVVVSAVVVEPAVVVVKAPPSSPHPAASTPTTRKNSAARFMPNLLDRQGSLAMATRDDRQHPPAPEAPPGLRRRSCRGPRASPPEGPWGQGPGPAGGNQRKVGCASPHPGVARASVLCLKQHGVQEVSDG
jgi:hypothetical protein